MSQSKLDQATLAIARATAEAKKEAAAAKKLAESPTVSAELDEEGRLKLNGTVSDIHLITPPKVSEAVGKAFADVKTPSLIITEQSKFEGEQIEAAAKIAIERGKFYIEDALTPDLRKKVYDGWYKNNPNKKDALQIVKLIQAWYDKLPSNVFISSRGGYFPFTKNTGYKPEYYGADGREITRGGIKLTVNGNQPCITFHHSIFNVYDFALAEFCVEEMGQDAFHICGQSQGNVILHGGKITTRAYKDYGYKSGRAAPDKRWIPHIDGWTSEKQHIGTGCSLKGTAEAGYNTTALNHDLICYLNNAADTSGVGQPEGYNLEKIRKLHIDESSQRYRSVGGYFDENGDSKFPRDDGTTADTWGTWRGGQVYSRGYGWRLFDCRGTEVRNFDVRGFTGGAVACGLHGSPSGENVDGGDVDTAYAKGLVAVNTRITGGYFTHNYTCGVEAIRVSGWEVTGIYAPDSVVGHPDAHLEHVRGWNNSVVSLDPGYCFCTSRYLPMDFIYVHDNYFGLGKRKMGDIHTGNNVKIINNRGRAMYYGISTVIEETFASKDNRVSMIADPASFYYQDSNIEIVGNIIVSGNIGIHPINGGTGVLSRRAANKWWLRCRQLIADNTVYAPRGLQCNYGHNHFIIERNQFTFALPFGDFYGMRYVSVITVTNKGSGYTSAPKVVITGGGAEAFGAEAEAIVKNGEVVEIRVRRVGSRYETPPTVTLEGGGGKGATATASVNTATYGMLVGAEGRYGTMLATQVRENYVQNSPDGNFARQMIFGRIKAGSIVGNHCDITPFRNAEAGKTKVGQPFVVDTVKYRSGLISNAFYGGEFDNCTIDENVAHNQLVDVSTKWTGRYGQVDAVKNYTPSGFGEMIMQEKIASLSEELAALKAKVAAAGAGNTSSETPVAPVIPPVEQPAAEQPVSSPTEQPETPVEPSAEPTVPAGSSDTAVKFTFEGLEGKAEEAVGSVATAKLKSMKNNLRLSEPDGWGSAFGEEDGHKVMRAMFTSGKAVRLIETEGIASDGAADSAIIVPFKAAEGGTPGAAYAVTVIKDRAIVNPALIINHDGSGFKLRHFGDLTINGAAVNPNQTYEYDKWYIAALTIKAGAANAYDKVRFGTNQNGNTGRNLTIGAGVEFVSGGVDSVPAKVAALMAEYAGDVE